jgi:hypothetical protein
MIALVLGLALGADDDWVVVANDDRDCQSIIEKAIEIHNSQGRDHYTWIRNKEVKTMTIGKELHVRADVLGHADTMEITSRLDGRDIVLEAARSANGKVSLVSWQIQTI